MKSKIRFLKVLLGTGLIASLLFFIFFPFICNSYLLPRLTKKLPFSYIELNLSKITPWNIRGTLSLSQNGLQIAAIPNFEIQYSPTSLIKGEIDTILLDSPTLHLRYLDRTFSVAGIKSKPGEPTQLTEPIAITSPVSIKKISVKNNRIVLRTEKKLHNIILDSKIKLGFSEKKEGKYKLSTLLVNTLTEGDLTLNTSLQGVFSPQGMLFNAEIIAPYLSEIDNLLPDTQNAALSGALTAKGQVALSPDLQISHYLANADINSFMGSIKQFNFTQTSRQKPVQIQLDGNHQDLNFTISGLSTKQPEEVDLSTSGKIDIINKNIVTTTAAHSTRLESLFTVEMNSRINSNTTSGSLNITGEPFDFNGDISVGSIKVKADVSYLEGNVSAQLTGNIKGIQSKSDQLFLENINWNVPLQFPLENGQSAQKGQFNISSIKYKGVKTAGLSTVVQQNKEGLKYNANIESQMDIIGQVHCAGSILQTGQATSSCSLSDTTIDSSRLPDFIKIPENTTFTGVLSAIASFELGGGMQQGSLRVHLAEGNLTSGETVIKRIETTIDFPNLLSLQSKPSQLATIGSIESGKIHLHDGKVIFRTEADQQLFLEKARLSWCGGKIELGSLRLNSEMKNLETTVYCDRLNFVDLLTQFGVEGTEGEGSLNGRLPIAIDDKGITFEDGFLFSTPGNNGIVRFNNTDQLRQGMPDLGQTATLDYSIKALENFAYNWTKLLFSTEGKDLLLTMQLDGKPASPLPFGYKSGQIIATKEGPGLQHPLRLDMNFRLPLQEIFQSGKSLQSLMEKM